MRRNVIRLIVNYQALWRAVKLAGIKGLNGQCRRIVKIVFRILRYSRLNLLEKIVFGIVALAQQSIKSKPACHRNIPGLRGAHSDSDGEYGKLENDGGNNNGKGDSGKR